MGADKNKQPIMNIRPLLFTTLLCLCLAAIAQESDSYAGYDRVTLYDSMTVRMEENGLSHYVNHQRYRVLSDAGCRDNNAVIVDYDPLSAYCEIRDVVIYRHDGAEEHPDFMVCDYPAPAHMIYWGARQKMVALGRLEIGDEVEFLTYKKGYSYALLQGEDPDAKYIPPMRGHFYDIVPFWSSQPVKEKVYQVSVLTNKNLQYKVYNGNLQVTTKKDGDRTVYTFSSKDYFPLKTPRYTVASNDIEPKLIVTTAQNWEAKSMWFYGVNEDFGSFEATAEIQQKVNELLKHAKTENDSLDILTHWVADNVRYSGISMGEGEGYTLHKCEMTFRDRCGVCKDKAGMLIGMLRAAGFKAYAAMTMAGERIEDIPADQFNHCITVVQRRNGNYQLLDPTWVPGVRGELWSSAEQQQNYLMGLPNGAKLGLTPVSDPKNHYVRMTAQSEVKKNGTLKATVTITADRQSDRVVRYVFDGFRTGWQRNVEDMLYREYPNAIIKSVKYTSEDDYLKQPVSITYKFEIPDYAVVTDKEVIATPFLANGFYTFVMRHLYYNTSLEKRDYPFTDRCSRYVTISETMKVPSGYTRVSTPKAQEFVTPSISFKGGYNVGYNMVTFTETISLGKRIYEADEWPAYRKAVQSQRYYMGNPVVYVK